MKRNIIAFTLFALTSFAVAQTDCNFRLYFLGGAAKTDGVAPATIQNEGAQDFYTLDGRKVNGNPTAKGIYIVNGKKVIRK